MNMNTKNMNKRLFLTAVILLIVSTLAFNSTRNSSRGSVAALPNPTLDAPMPTAKGEETAVLSGGCFWGIQAVFKHVKGVIDVKSGYSGGSAATAHYEMVSDGNTGHAESVRISFDPSQVSYGQLLKVFFSVAHDPTELNRQGPDTGSQYRSVVFYADEDQKRIALAYIDQLNQAKVFGRPIVTQVVALRAFYEAEGYHQDYAVRHPTDPYIAINDLPKVENLRRQFPDLYVAK
jgi:peptide-methionine (S)-S-oxide reductase